ncbi:hypothetical protein VN12_23565 [Pirellula sp. SH-Sr6A]|nr:hypothetical protein VN12_23565 [Pirellula sp. SH-Sr6A]
MADSFSQSTIQLALPRLAKDKGTPSISRNALQTRAYFAQAILPGRNALRNMEMRYENLENLVV